MRKIFYCLVAILCVTSCDPADTRLVIRNNSDKVIYFTNSNSRTVDFNPYLQAFTITNKDTVWREYNNRLTPMGHSAIGVIGSWESVLKHSYNDTMYIYFFEEDTLKKYKSGYENKYEALKIISTNKLKSAGWEICYP